MTTAAPALEIVVNHETDAWSADIGAPLVGAARAALVTALRTNATAVELGITLTDDATIQELNRDHRHQDKPTNVLSFPLTEVAHAGDRLNADPPDAPLLLGDIILAWETVNREASAQNKSTPDHARHLVVHGTLHLLGYDHESDADADVMERLEIAILTELGVADPYGTPPLCTPNPDPNPEPP